MVAVADTDWHRLGAALADTEEDQTLYVEGTTRTRRGRLSTSLAEPGSSYAKQMIAASTVVTVWSPTIDPGSGRVYGDERRCVIQRWTQTGDQLRSPAPNPAAEYVQASLLRAAVDQENGAGVIERRLPSDPLPHIDEVGFPIDLVYMWVDGSDPDWRHRFEERTAHTHDGTAAGSPGETTKTPDAIAPWRFRDQDELLYSLRSVEMYAPWIRHVHLVTDHQLPRWLNTEHPKIRVHFHDEIFADPSALPVFNSHAIGTQLHHIEGLAEHYLYMNDDVLFGGIVEPEHFFTASGIARIRRSKTSSPIVPFDALSEIEAARFNSARLIEQRHGVRPTSLFGHTPIPQVRSVAMQLEAAFPDAFDRTMRSVVRAKTDIEPNSWLHLNELLATGRAVESHVPYGYFLLGTATGRERLSHALKTGSAHVLCLNDSASEDGKDYATWLRRQLDRAYPHMSTFELPAHRCRSFVTTRG